MRQLFTSPLVIYALMKILMLGGSERLRGWDFSRKEGLCEKMLKWHFPEKDIKMEEERHSNLRKQLVIITMKADTVSQGLFEVLFKRIIS